MKINVRKKKITVIAKTKMRTEILIDGCTIEHVIYFCYLGQTITDAKQELKYELERKRLDFTILSLSKINNTLSKRIDTEDVWPIELCSRAERSII